MNATGIRRVLHGRSVGRLQQLLTNANYRTRVLSTSPKQDKEKVDQTATALFRMMNPEFFLSTKRRSTWILVGSVWVVFGSYTCYLYIKDAEEEQRTDTFVVGPKKKDGKY